MSFRQDRTNPSTAVSNWHGRSETPKGHPSTRVSTWMNGGLFGGGMSMSYTGSVFYDLPFTDGYNYFGCESSGTLTVVGSGTVDMLVVGGGGGNDMGIVSYPNRHLNGGGGGGGVTRVASFDIVAGDYAVVIGAKGTQGTTTTSSGTDGGDTTIYINGVWISAGGGGRGGMGNGTAQAGSPGRQAPSSYSTYRGSGGGGGGGGVYYAAAGSAGGLGGASASSGSPATGTFTINNGGAGGSPSYADPAGGGGGCGWNASGSGTPGGQGYEGIQWNNYLSSSYWYGQGGSNASVTSPNTNPQTDGRMGKGGSQFNGIGKDGTVIFKWAP